MSSSRIGRGFALAFMPLVWACGTGDAAKSDITVRSAQQALSSVGTNKTSYTPSETAVITFSEAAGTPTDWVGIAPVGSDDAGYVRWKYTNGSTEGTLEFLLSGLSGDYEARLYSNDSLERIATSAPFHVAVGSASVTRDKASYSATESANVSWAGGPGTMDWLALAPVGSADGSYLRWQYTGGANSGSTPFSLEGIPAGSYVFRFYTNDDFTLLATSEAFDVSTATAASVTSNAGAYVNTQTATISFSGAAATPTDWIAIAPAGSPDAGYVLWQYTGGTASGSRNFALSGLNGSYVARLYANDGFELQGTSAPFTVYPASTVSVTTDRTSYLAGADATVSFSGAPASGKDWITIAPAGSPDNGYITWQYTNQQASGSLVFSTSSLPDGAYVARLYAYDNFDLRGESQPFQVGSSSTVSTNKSSYTAGEGVTVNWANLPGNEYDWVALTTPGAPAGSYSYWYYTYGQPSGSYTFLGVQPGTYVARAHINNGNDIASESASFTVSP